jgi:hypothetical protein
MIKEQLDTIWPAQSHLTAADFDPGEPVAIRDHAPAIVAVQRNTIRLSGVEVPHAWLRRAWR